jgi:cytoskeletal protein CcmA (bactofilin family)
MFKGKKTVKIDPNTTDTLIGEGTVFEGHIKSEASIRVEGRITGDIVCKGDVTIGDKGNASSNISARNVIIAGIVRGNVSTSEKLTITSTGKLHGNTNSKSFIIDDGGTFMGTSKMDSKDSSGEKPEKDLNPQAFNRNYNDSAANM